MTGLCCLFMEQIIGVFLTDQDAYGYACSFGRILLTTRDIRTLKQENERSRIYEDVKNIAATAKGI